jgi:hypothetical protein
MNLLVIHIVAFYSQERLLEKLREEEAASQAVLLKGDVICSTNTNKQRSTTPPLVSGRSTNQNQQQVLIHGSQTSVCSCTCMETFNGWRKMRRKRARWKKQQHDARNKAMKTSDSNESFKAIFDTRRCSV